MIRKLKWLATTLTSMALVTLRYAILDGQINRVWLFLAALAVGSVIVAITKKVIQLAFVVLVALVLISLPREFWDHVIVFFQRLFEVAS